MSRQMTPLADQIQVTKCATPLVANAMRSILIFVILMNPQDEAGLRLGICVRRLTESMGARWQETHELK